MYGKKVAAVRPYFLTLQRPAGMENTASGERRGAGGSWRIGDFFSGLAGGRRTRLCCQDIALAPPSHPTPPSSTMCGIDCLLDLSGRTQDSQHVKERLERGLDAIAHRGPDGRGTWVSNDTRVGTY